MGISPARMIASTQPIVIRRRRPRPVLRECVIGVAVAFMAALTLASVVMIAAQTPTFRKTLPPPHPPSNDAPVLASPRSDSRDEVMDLRFEVLRDSYVELKEEMVKQREDDKAQTIKLELQGAAIARMEMYLFGVAGILASVVVGILIQIYQSRTNGRLLRQHSGFDNTLQG